MNIERNETYLGLIAEIKLWRYQRRLISGVSNEYPLTWGSDEEGLIRKLIPTDRRECSAILIWFYSAKIRWLL